MISRHMDYDDRGSIDDLLDVLGRLARWIGGTPWRIGRAVRRRLMRAEVQRRIVQRRSAR